MINLFLQQTSFATVLFDCFLPTFSLLLTFLSAVLLYKCRRMCFTKTATAHTISSCNIIYLSKGLDILRIYNNSSKAYVYES